MKCYKYYYSPSLRQTSEMRSPPHAQGTTSHAPLAQTPPLIYLQNYDNSPFLNGTPEGEIVRPLEPPIALSRPTGDSISGGISHNWAHEGKKAFDMAIEHEAYESGLRSNSPYDQ